MIAERTETFKCSRRELVKLVAILALLFLILPLSACSSGTSTHSSSSSGGSTSTNSQPAFEIEGKWVNTGEDTFGQIQKNSVIVFDGNYCNVYSPKDTYAFYKENGAYKLNITGLLGGSDSFTVEVIDEDHISFSPNSSTNIKLTRAN